MAEVLAMDPARCTNRMLMADCARLGYLAPPVADATFGLGRFWAPTSTWSWALTEMVDRGDLVEAPPFEWRFDLNPDRDATCADFRALPLPDAAVATLVLDPPYKLAGTSSGRGPSALDAGYGVTEPYRPIADLHEMIFAGIDEAARVVAPGGHLLLKCQAQQSCGQMVDQPGIFAAYASRTGWWRDVDRLHVVTTPRKQPRQQRTARSNVSTLVVLRRRARRSSR